jgi:lysophospholipase L1-like esterase
MRKALLVAQLVVVLLIARNWAYVTTYRLYLDQRIDASDRSSATQQFDVDHARVVPRIVTRGSERVSFAADVRQDSTIRVELRPAGPATYTLAWHDGSRSRVLATGAVDSATSIVSVVPLGSGVVELASDAAASWVDPRIVRGLDLRRDLIALALLATGFALTRRERATRRFAWRLTAVTLSAIAACAAAEVGLRALGDAAPGGIITLRHDLGEVTRDPRWIESPRYGRRLRPNVDIINEWRHGDIVRMGYIPPPVRGGTRHRFRFKTDADGFRNATVREHIEIAALGDSFTDATITEATWPSRLEQRLGVTVQNYGTAGFGPQQERLVLQDFVAPHRPRLVVLAFFAGNDILDAEAFDAFQRSGEQRALPGWPIKDVVSRFDTWFVASAWRAGTRWIGSSPDVLLAAGLERPVDATAQRVTPSFDRGMFTVPVGDRAVRFAFMPPYLNSLNYSEADLRAWAGWPLTEAAIRDMRETSHAFGAEFIVMFVPFKSQVYLPLVEQAFSPAALRAALAFSLDRFERPVDLDLLHRNRLAQNTMVRQLCEAERIPFLDTTAALEARVQAGQDMYFPDESHLNEAGEAQVAETLAAFVRDVKRNARP